MPGPSGGRAGGGGGRVGGGGGRAGGGMSGSFGGGAGRSSGGFGGSRPSGSMGRGPSGGMGGHGPGMGGPGHPGFGGPHHHRPPHGHHYHRPFFGGGWHHRPRRHTMGCGLFPLVFCIIFFIVIVMNIRVGNWVLLDNNNSFGNIANEVEVSFSINDDDSEITVVYENKEPLDASLCTPVERYYESSIDGAIDETNEQVLIDGLQSFYKTTGVQPYVIFTNDIDGNTEPEYEDIDTYLCNKYVELFGEDEGHFILLYIEDEYLNYELWYIVGYDADDILDDESMNTLLSYADNYLWYGGDYANIFSQAFTQAADEIMLTENVIEPVVTEDATSLLTDDEGDKDSGRVPTVILILVFVAAVAGIIVLSVFMIKKNRKENEKINSDDEAQQYTASRKNKTNPYEKQYGTKEKRVICPECGANAYPDRNNKCSYCGKDLSGM